MLEAKAMAIPIEAGEAAVAAAVVVKFAMRSANKLKKRG